MEQMEAHMESLSLATQEITTQSRPSWLELKDGYEFCSLCHLFATDAHLKSERHLRKEEWHNYIGSDSYAWRDPAEGPPPKWGNPEMFEWREGWWWCRVCSQWADAFHVQGKRHQWREPWADWYILYDKDRKALTYNAPQVPMLEAGTEHSTKSAGAPRKEAAPDPWGADWEASVKALDSKSSTSVRESDSSTNGRPPSCSAPGWEAWRPTTEAKPQLQQEPDVHVASFWRRTWCAEHERSYFWHVDTGERRWDLPDGVANDIDVEWSS